MDNNRLSLDNPLIFTGALPICGILCGLLMRLRRYAHEALKGMLDPNENILTGSHLNCSFIVGCFNKFDCLLNNIEKPWITFNK